MPTQLDMDFSVPSEEDLERHRQRAEHLGAMVIYDRSHDEGDNAAEVTAPAGRLG